MSCKVKRMRHRSSKDRLAEELERLRIFGDGIDEEVYVSDPETFDVLFANKKIEERFGKDIVGKKCYKIFQDRYSPCPFCNIDEIFGKNLGKKYVRELQNLKNKRWYKCMGCAIPWPGGKYVRYGVAIDITEQKEIKQVSFEQERRFRSIVENSHDGITIIDEKFRIVYANGELRRMFGCPTDKITGQDFRSFLDKKGKTLMRNGLVKRLLKKRSQQKYEFGVMRRDSSRTEVEAKFSAMREGQDGAHVICQLLDVAERQRIEKERRGFEERLSALNKYGQSLNMAGSPKEIHEVTLDAMEKTLGFEHASILMVHGKKLCLTNHRGYPRKFGLALDMEKDVGVTIKAAKNGKVVRIPDVRKERNYILGKPGMLSELAVPIRIGSKVLGVLNVESRRVNAFDRNDSRLLEILASHAATAISNIRRQDQLKDVSRKLACLMKSAMKVMNVRDMHRRLNIIAGAISRLGWRRVVISLRDEELEQTDLVTVGLTEEEKELLQRRKASSSVWRQRLGPRFERFRIGGFHYLPWADQWIREHVHGAPAGSSDKKWDTYAGVPSNRPSEEMVDWHPQDMLYAPLVTPEGRIVGILCMDDPVDGRVPTLESLAPLELFLHQAAMIIENAQLIEYLREAREDLERKVDERTRELRASQEQLLKAQRLAVIGELAGMVGHDLRNPLTSIAGAAYYLKKRPILAAEPRLLEMLDLVERNIVYSNKIINDLLDYSREISLDLAEVRPRQVVEEALSMVEVPSNVRIRNLAQDEPMLKIDAERIKRTLINLIRNAFDAMGRGGTLTIESRREDGHVEVSVSDTGAGMKRETLEKLWTPLFTTKAKGMGFGLSICKRIVEAHDGSLSVVSHLGKGTTFKLTLPIEARARKGGEEAWMKPPESSLLTMTRT